MNKPLLQEYADLKIEEKIIKTKVENMKFEVLQELQSANMDEVLLEDVGTLVVIKKRTYSYPQAIVQMEEALAQAKVEAEAKGEATYKESAFIQFKAVKAK